MISVSGKDYKAANRTIQEKDIIAMDLVFLTGKGDSRIRRKYVREFKGTGL